MPMLPISGLSILDANVAYLWIVPFLMPMLPISGLSILDANVAYLWIVHS
jgi:hypothetical protein